MKNIQHLVDETLNSFDGVHRAEANPFLYTKIEQRLKNRYEPPVSYQKLMPALAVALVLFISLNVVSYFKVSTSNATSASKSTASGVENFANEYNLSEEEGL